MTANDLPGSFEPSANWTHIRRRAELLRAARNFFDAQGFVEVETPLLSADVVIDRHLDPLGLTLFVDPRQPEVGRRMWLQTSPEFAMKRLMAAGGEAIYQITRAFRGAEIGPLHNPEFTILEWYRRGDSMDGAMRLLSLLCHALLATGPAEKISFADAFMRHVGLDPHRASSAELAEMARRRNVAVPESTNLGDRLALIELLHGACVEPHLGRSRPVIIYDYPAEAAALAVVRPGPPPVAERFELYVCGIELANGYHELRDVAELTRRFEEANRGRAADGKPLLPVTSELTAAMEAGLPDCCGVALGFDRLVMVAFGARTLAEVMAFPIDRA